MAKAGSSDIQGIRNDGRFLAIEVKLPTTRKTVTKLQNQFLNDIAQKGGIAGVATSGEEAMAIVEGKEVFNPYEYEDNHGNENTGPNAGGVKSGKWELEKMRRANLVNV